jgi:molybdopterin-guanine dinucleotide biosynthesis protein B
MNRTAPIVSIVGKADSGKTTFLEKLIAEMTSRGWRVATVKHHAHSEESVDIVGKDSWRHRQAGAPISVVASAKQIEVVRELNRELTLDEIADMIGDDVDVILTEGYKREGRNRIEVSRVERSDTLVCEPGEAIAVVTDNEAFDPFGMCLYGLDEADAVADLIEEKFLGARHAVAEATPAVEPTLPADASPATDSAGRPVYESTGGD